MTSLALRWHAGNETLDLVAHNIFSLGERSDLGGSIVRFSWFHYPPFVSLAAGDSAAAAVGFYADILEELQARLNFSREYVAAGPKEKWGAKTANGTWNGMIGKSRSVCLKLSPKNIKP